MNIFRCKCQNDNNSPEILKGAKDSEIMFLMKYVNNEQMNNS